MALSFSEWLRKRWSGSEPPVVVCQMTGLLLLTRSSFTIPRNDISDAREVDRLVDWPRPNQTKRSPAPLIHAVAKEIRETFWLAYSMFVAAFREAAEKLKAGELSSVRFPVGSFPPGLPFVRAHPARSP